MSVRGKYLSDFPNLVDEVDYELNINIDISKITAGSHKKIWWVCNKKLHKHSWKTSIGKRTQEQLAQSGRSQSKQYLQTSPS